MPSTNALAESAPALPDKRNSINTIFLSYTCYAGSITGSWSMKPLWSGAAEYSLGVANGNTIRLQTLAFSPAELELVDDGESIFKIVCTPTPTATEKALLGPLNYPNAVVRDKQNLIAGYLLDEPELKGIAVLTVPTFNVRNSNAKYAFDLFKPLFRKKAPYFASRIRSMRPLELHDAESDISVPALGGSVGSYEQLGSNMSSLASLDFSSSDDDTPIHAYSDAKDEASSPFKSEDVLIITDGVCSSSCPIFIEMMKYEGVKTVAFGAVRSMARCSGWAALGADRSPKGDSRQYVPVYVGAWEKVLNSEELQPLKASVSLPLECPI
ncbi:uncharacterized protein ATNIH1004_007213 [Aspergillus tanneri]|uniref:Tail specific protease domain-containing protein n=1 Tax=Aspergillus tanneri TaxID=1220188 RepID=A0A5M9MLE5_9EURO|nr:uncharacterized protein ATNIH1004_007213 [Aspergillus tanneri]KAA8645793.1 hypothetical protein ATNIH1004_007213 [Aspergillus tanneri]